MRVNFNVSSTNVPDARIEENIVHARSLGLPYVADRAGGRPLNVIGRGPSVADHIDALKNDDADDWAAGTAWAWCRDNGIDAVFVCADAHHRMVDYTAGVKVALVAEQCDPSLFAALSGAEVKLISMDTCAYGWTAATIAAVLGATADSETRLYGCEGSYAEKTHADEDIPQANLMIVRANGQIFRTNPQMIMQSEEFALLFRICKPGTFVDRSGGLLGALLASGGEWELIEWKNAPANVRELLEREKNTGNPGWGDDGLADWDARAAQ